MQQMDLFMNSVQNKNLPKPFLKWAGGKTQLLQEIEKRLPDHIKESSTIEKYFEPFVGGGAVFFHLINNYKIKYAYLSDINKDLILTYNIIINNPHELIEELKAYYSTYMGLTSESRKILFYTVRDLFNSIPYDKINPQKNSKENLLRASQMIFLNKTCFNGLYRVNKKGKFNVPFASPKNPLICDEDNILRVSEVLKNVTIVCDTYLKSKKLIDNKSFVYLDPPYKPINGKKSFEGYSKSEFNDENQMELSQFYRDCSNKGAFLLLSNSDPKNIDSNNEFFDKLYKEYNISRINAKRFINSKGNKRGEIKEILISNYQI